MVVRDPRSASRKEGRTWPPVLRQDIIRDSHVVRSLGGVNFAISGAGERVVINDNVVRVVGDLDRVFGNVAKPKPLNNDVRTCGVRPRRVAGDDESIRPRCNSDARRRSREPVDCHIRAIHPNRRVEINRSGDRKLHDPITPIHRLAEGARTAVV